MIPRVVYDTMVFLQWFGLPDNRQHGSLKAVLEDRVRPLLSNQLIAEVKEVLSRPAIRSRMTRLTDESLNTVLNAVLIKAEFVSNPSSVFTLPQHSDDDHILNLAIAGQAEFLVTWENRLLKLAAPNSEKGNELRALAPQLVILNPIDFMAELKRAGESAKQEQ